MNACDPCRYVFFFQCPFLPEMWLNMADMRSIEQFFTGPKFGIKHQGMFSVDDIEAWKFVYGQKGELLFCLDFDAFSVHLQAPGRIRSTTIAPPSRKSLSNCLK